MSGPAKPAAAPGSVIPPARPPLPPAPTKGALPHSGKPVAVNGNGNGAAMANAVNAGMPQPSAAAKPTIAKPVSAYDAKSAPGAGGVVAKVADAKVGVGKSTPLTQQERAQQLAVGIKQRAEKAAQAIRTMFIEEAADMAVINYRDKAYPKDAQKYRHVSAVDGSVEDMYFRNGKLIKDAQAEIAKPLTAVQQAALPHLISYTAGAIQSNPDVAGYLAQAEPGVHFDKSQIVRAQAIKTLKAYPF